MPRRSRRAHSSTMRNVPRWDARRHFSPLRLPDAPPLSAEADDSSRRANIPPAGAARGLLPVGGMTGEETFHPDTRALLAYGRVLAGSGDPPPRAPGQSSGADRVAERLFVFDRMTDGRLLMRTFGAELVALFGADLRDRDFLSLWPGADRVLLAAFLNAVADAAQPGVLRATAETGSGARIGVEILLTPLRTPPATADRYLGLLQPLGGEAFVTDAIARLRLGALHPPEARVAPSPPRLVVSNR